MPLFGKKKHKYIVSLTAKGRRKFLGIVEAEDVNELMNILSEKIQGLEDGSSYPNIRIYDSSVGSEIRIENPFFSGEEATSEPTQSKSSKNSLAVDLVLADVEEGLKAVAQINQTLYSQMMTMPIQVMNNMINQLMQLMTAPQAQNPQGTILRDGANFLMALIEVAKNRKDVEELLKNINIKDVITKLNEPKQQQ